MNKVLLVLCLVAVACAIPLKQNKLRFTIKDEWVLVPDSDGRLHMSHKSEIFDTELEGRFDGEADIIFILHTRENGGSQVFQFGDRESLLAAGFNPAWPTRFMIHGWNGNGSGNQIIRNAYLDTGDFNVIFVDWAAGAVNPNYITARNNVNIAGPVVGRLISETLVALGGASYSDIYIMGHSLGAHVAGLAGKNTESKVRCAYGLDPAGPLFSTDLPDERIDADDAEYVEIMHTNGGLLGFRDPIGHADFFPNGGTRQVGCGADTLGGCSHGRTVNFYAESIRNRNAFRAIPCEISSLEFGNCTLAGPEAFMGGEPSNVGLNVFGNYFLTTNEESPFGQG